MLLYAEGFDNIHPIHYARIPGFACSSYFPGTANQSLFPFGVDVARPILVNKRISEGCAIVLGNYLRPCVFEKTKVVVFGFSLATINYDYGTALTDGVGAHTKGGTESWKFPGAGSDNYIDVCFLNDPKSDDATGVGFKCRIYYVDYFNVRARFITKDSLADGYPVIPQSGKIPVDMLSGNNYFEVMVSADGAYNSNGYAELRINGRSVYKQENIVTSPYNDYFSDPLNYLAHFSGVALVHQKYWTSDNQGSYYGDRFFVDYLVDDMYVLNGEGGVNDTFLGPVKIKPSDTYVPSVTDFEAVDGAVVVDDPSDLSSFLGNVLQESPARYLQAPTEFSKNENAHMFNVPVSSPVFAVLSRVVATANPGTSQPSADFIYNCVRFPGSSNSFTPVGFPAKAIPGVVSISDAIINYDLGKPGLWTLDSAKDSLYGFQYKSGIVSDITSGLVFGSRRSVTGDISDILDSSTSTSILFAASANSETLSYVDFLFPSSVFIDYVEVVFKSDYINQADPLGSNIRSYFSPFNDGNFFKRVTSAKSVSVNGSLMTIRFSPVRPFPVSRLRIESAVYYYSYQPTSMYSIRAVASQGD